MRNDFALKYAELPADIDPLDVVDMDKAEPNDGWERTTRLRFRRIDGKLILQQMCFGYERTRGHQIAMWRNVPMVEGLTPPEK